ncbi:hypothetical protein LXD69_07330 [Flavobacterium sediminilitoris]|uniref:Gp37 protein n=1 Tax=Flavobacterium sediminilitoris TaxID=2024526 RepID=A0ABY4HR17_9FLAO|nr:MULTISPECIES: hypothetical protein [Flavobacterium]UOX35323.1 hypothetical protein LXD69_07330 [Flavobacterium sediminilitoris]
MDRILSYTKVDDYFKSLANKHLDINDYIGTSTTELDSRMSSVDGIASPFLCLFNYQGKLSGNMQRTFNDRTLSFSICFTGIEAEDFPAQKAAINAAEVIGLEILSRINVESKNPAIGWLYDNFQKDTVHYSEIELDKAEGFFGMEFHFDLKNSEPLVVTPDKWSDGDQFCTV